MLIQLCNVKSYTLLDMGHLLLNSQAQIHTPHFTVLDWVASMAFVDLGRIMHRPSN